MHNGGKPPDFSFDSAGQLGREVRLRAAAIKGMEKVHEGCCGYPASGAGGKLDPAYWDKKGCYQFVLKAGKKPSDAIEAIFKPGAETKLDCNSTMVAIQYRAMLTTLGAAGFDKKFAGRSGIDHLAAPRAAGRRRPSSDLGDRAVQKDHHHRREGSAARRLGYFKNHSDYADKHRAAIGAASTRCTSATRGSAASAPTRTGRRISSTKSFLRSTTKGFPRPTGRRPFQACRITRGGR